MVECNKGRSVMIFAYRANAKARYAEMISGLPLRVLLLFLGSVLSLEDVFISETRSKPKEIK